MPAMPEQKTAKASIDKYDSSIEAGSGQELLAQALQALAKRNFYGAVSGTNQIVINVGLNAQQLCDFVAAKGVNIFVTTASKSDPAATDWGRATLLIDSEIDLKLAIDAIDNFCDSYLIGFDLDGTLVDTVDSFDTAVKELIKRHSGRPLLNEELKNLRAEGGFNNNWDAAVELIKRRGKVLTRQQLDPEALEIYFSLAASHETLLVDLKTLDKLAKRHRLFILTGRCQFEYKPVWEGRLGDNFQQVYCLDDLPHCKPKPAADSLNEILKLQNATSGVYVGNAMDDMWSARAANMQAIAVTTTHSAKELTDAGAQLTYDLPDGVLGAFLI